MEGTKVYVGKIPSAFKKEELLAIFNDCGKIVGVKIVNPRFRQRSFSTVFLTFENAAGAQTAVAKKNGMKFMDAELEVQIARPRGEARPVREPRPKRELTPEEIAAIPNSVYLGNLSFKVTEEDIRGAFKAYGTVKTVKIMGQVRRLGYGYVEFSSPAEATAALDFNGKMLNERPLRVEVARGPNDRPVRAPREPRAPRQPRAQQEPRAPRTRAPRQPRRDEAEAEPTIPVDEKTIYVGDLPENVKPEVIHEKLKVFGTILNIQLATVENRPKYGYVHFDKSEEAQKAIAASGSVKIDDKVIRMEQPRPRRARTGPRTRRPRTGPREPRSDAPVGERPPRRPRAPFVEPEASTEVHVGNLPRALGVKGAEDELRKLFAGVGAIKAISTPQFQSGDFRGFAYVTFNKVEEANAARSKSEIEIGGRKIRVTYARPAAERVQPKA